MTATIDTHEGVKRLIGAGFTQQQAEQTVKLLSDWSGQNLEHLVTKEHLGLELAKLRAELREEMAEMRQEITREMAAQERRLTTRMVTLAVASVTILGILIAIF